MANAVVESSFPVGALLPKSETGVLNFLQKYPEYDGRDVTIAILDSGVDSRASGLQTVKDGSVKIIHRFDCSGCGDTDTSKVVKANSDGCITGLSGRTLQLTKEMLSMNQAGNEFHIGLKSMFDLYPSKIRDRVSKYTKLKNWDEPQKIATADIARKLAEFESKHSDTTNLSYQNKLEKENLNYLLEFLNTYEKAYLDIKTTYDCVVYQTENGWKAIVDITEKGDLENALHIGEFCKTHEVLNVDEFLSITVNVHDEGNVLEIVGMCSSHGTHVASIASGNSFNKDFDGVAPNAKIVSLTIGDGRLGSMETGKSLVKAMVKVMELCNMGTKIDVINMSYGEHAHWSNYGRLGQLMTEVVNKYGVVWVSSAGNHGPALCTIGTPPDIVQSCCIGVGAYVSPQMMEAEYALREKLPANVYTWTSRDPCIDGGQGVTVCAPGAAIASVPEFTMSKAQLMNGTSMAAPHVAGAVALLISGLKQKYVDYSPFSIKRALCATATHLNYVDKFAQGSGLLNVEKAFEHLIHYDDEQENMVRFTIRIGMRKAKGIHLRNRVLTKPTEYSVTIDPVFLNDCEADSKAKLEFNVRISLICSEPWVQCGSFLDLCYSARSILVKVDPTSLPPGIHTAVIKGYDTKCVHKGSLFEIPVTVVQPEVLDNNSHTYESKGIVEFKANTIQRDFILVPKKASWAVLRMRSAAKNVNQTGKFCVHTMQILPLKYCKEMETNKLYCVNNESETVHAFCCEPDNILEVCIAKYWSNFGDSQLKYSVEFHGINIENTNGLRMLAPNGIHQLDIGVYGTEDIQPIIQLKQAVIILKPIESKISPLSATRDVIPAGRQIYENLLTYNLHVSKPNEIALHVPVLCSVLYESEFESQMWMLFDANKMMVTCGDAYSQSHFRKLDKGDYVIRLQVRHERKDMLEKVNEVNMLATFKLANAINLDSYEHFNKAVIGAPKFTACSLNKNITKSLFLTPLPYDKLAKSNIPSGCSWLNGTIMLTKDELGKRVENNFSFQYVLGNENGNSKKSSNGNSSSNSQSNTKNDSPTKAPTTNPDEYKDAFRDFQCSMIPKLDLVKAEDIYKEVIEAHPKHLIAHLLLIQNLESTENKIQYPFTFAKYIKNVDDVKIDVEKLSSVLNRIIELADIVINDTNKDILLAYYGMKNDTRSDAAKIKTTMEKQKLALLEAFSKKGVAMCKLQIIENSKDGEIKTSTEAGHGLDEINEIYGEIGKFVDGFDSKVINFSVWHAHVHGHNGRLAKYLNRLYEEKLSREIIEEFILMTSTMKWDHLKNLLEKISVTSNPMGYRLF